MGNTRLPTNIKLCQQCLIILDQRRIDSRLVLLNKDTYDLVAIPASDYLIRNTRSSSGPQGSLVLNQLGHPLEILTLLALLCFTSLRFASLHFTSFHFTLLYFTKSHSLACQQITGLRDYYKYTFFPWTVITPHMPAPLLWHILGHLFAI